MANITSKKTSWDLSKLFKSKKDPAIEKERKSAKKTSYEFINKWKGRDDYLKNPKVLRQALDEFESWAKEYGAITTENYYFKLKTGINQNNPKLKGKKNKALEFGKKIENEMRFFLLNISKIDKKHQEKFLNDERLKPYKHFLEKRFAYSKYLLSDSEEKIMNLKTTTSHSNWVQMTQEFLSTEERKVLGKNGKPKNKNFSQILGLINNKNKKVRDKAADALNEIFEKHLELAEIELNSVLQNKKINDHLRGYERPDKARHIGDDIDTEVVDTLVKTVTDNFHLAKKYYKLKAKLFKVPKLEYHERNVEYGKTEKEFSYNEGAKLVLKVLKDLDPEFADIFSNFAKNGQIDVYPKKGKRSGAFATYGLLKHPVYILLNWNSLLKDVQTFAHELGHGINFELAKKQNALNFGTPISTTEVASTFMEDFVIKELMKQADDKLKLSLIMSKLNSDISSIFRQIAFYNFERELHKNFREEGYLSKKQIGKMFQKHMTSYMGSAVEQSEGSENWWIYVQHFRYFFYVYSYSSGLLISKFLQASVKENPEFINKVKKFMSAGLSDSPKNIFKGLGVDITDENFWGRGISEVEGLLKEAESLAEKLGEI